MKGNTHVLETTMLDVAERTLVALLPASWQVIVLSGDGRGDAGVDAYLRLVAPDGKQVTFLVEARQAYGGTEEIIGKVLLLARKRRVQPLLVVPYAGPGLRRACEDDGVNFIDLTGWVSVRAESPGLAVRNQGAQRDPRPGRTAEIRRMGGPGAGRVIRSLLATSAPVGVRELAGSADVAPGTVSKVLKALEAEALVRREPAGVSIVNKRDLVTRWTQDYGFLRSNQVAWCLAPRGLHRVLDRAAERDVQAVGTGSIALQRYLPEGRLPVTTLAQLALYVPDVGATRRALDLIETERATANVLLAQPYDSQLLAVESGAADSIPVVDAGQAVADLSTLPGRASEEAAQLMDLLAEGDPAWR